MRALEILLLKVFTDNKFMDLITIHSITKKIKIRSYIAHNQTESCNNCATSEKTQYLGYMLLIDLNQISTNKYNII